MKHPEYSCDVCGVRESPNPAATVRFPHQRDIHLCSEHADDVRAVIEELLDKHEGKTMPLDFSAD